MWNGKQKAVTFSYDDGVVQDIRLIERLNHYGLKCTFNLNSELLGQGGMLHWGENRIVHYKLRPEDVRAVYEGHEVAVHTLTHPNLTEQTDEEVIRQVECDRRNLEELMGYPIVGMAYPCGGVNNDDRVAALIREHTGVKYCRTITSSESFAPQENLYRFNPTVSHLCGWDHLMETARRFVEADPADRPLLYVWGHSFEMDLATENWQRLDEFFAYISGRDDVFYGTNREVLLG